MKRTLCLVFVLTLTLAASRTFASDPVGIYALIDRVVLEPSDSQPQRIQVWGAFSFAVKNFGDQYTPPVRGYLYYQLPPEQSDVARAEWSDLQKSAGTGQIIAFGSRYKQFGVLRRGAGPLVGRDVSDNDIAARIALLDDQQQSKRDAATDDLKRAGAAAEPKLRAALASASPEAKNRIERILADLQPDPYPIGFGLARVRGDRTSEHVKALRTFPSAFSPADGTVVEAGTVKLIAGNIAAADVRPQYKFEIESSAGQHESSSAIQQGQVQTEWTPKMQLKPGEKYTWRVWVEDGKSRGPVAESVFRAK